MAPGGKVHTVGSRGLMLPHPQCTWLILPASPPGPHTAGLSATFSLRRPQCPAQSSPLHACAAHGDLASPQAVAELGGDGDEAGTQAPSSTRLGVDAGLHEAAELVQGVDGADQLRGARAHARTVSAGHRPAFCPPPPSRSSSPGLIPN